MGQPAGLESGMGPSLWPPHPGFQEPDMRMSTGEEQNSVDSALAPQHDPLTSQETVMATTAVSSQQYLLLRALTALQPCATMCDSPTESSCHFRRQDSTKPILQMRTLTDLEVKPSAQGHTASEWQRQTEPRAVCSRRQNLNLTMWQVVKGMGSGPRQPGSMSWLCPWGTLTGDSFPGPQHPHL